MGFFFLGNGVIVLFPRSVDFLLESVPLDDGLDGGNILGLIHTVRAVVCLDDLDLVPVLDDLELLQVLLQLSRVRLVAGAQRLVKLITSTSRTCGPVGSKTEHGARWVKDPEKGAGLVSGHRAPGAP